MNTPSGQLLGGDLAARRVPRAGGEERAPLPGDPPAPEGSWGHRPISLRARWRHRDKGPASQNPFYFQHQPFGILNH